MRNLHPVKIFLILFLQAATYNSYAGDTLSGKYPRCILVQLRSEHNRITALTNGRRYKEAAEVKKDAAEVQKRVIYDFSANFHYCPVYYYVDTNTDLIKEKKFAGILMNADSSIARYPVINNTSSDYFIVFYGYALSQTKASHVVKDESKNTYDPDSPNGKGLVVLNDEYQQIDNFYKLGYDDIFFKTGKKRKKLKKYYYESKHYDIEYYPFAQLFQENMGDRYSRHRIDARPVKSK